MTSHELALRTPGRPVSVSSPRAGWSDVMMMLHDYRWLLAGGLLLGLVVASVIYILTPLTFRSESRLLVRYVADSTLADPGAAGSRVMTPDVRGEQIMNTEVEIFSNRASIEAVVDAIGPTNFPGVTVDEQVRARAIRLLLEHLRIESPRRGNIIHIQYDAITPDHALAVMNTLVEIYLNKHLAVHRSAAAYDFLSKQTDQSRARLAETEEELRKVKMEAGPGLTSESSALMMQRIHDLRRQLGVSQAELAVSKARYDSMPAASMVMADRSARRAISRSTGSISRGAIPDRMAQLQSREHELIKVYTEDSVPIRELRAQMASLLAETPPEHEPASTLTESSSAVMRWTGDAEIVALEAGVNILRDQLAQATEEALRLEQIQLRLDQLERTRDIQEDHYRNFARSMEQARINDALDPGKIGNISLLQPAMLVAANYRPGIRRHVLMATGGGLFLAIVLVPVYESFTGGRRVRRLRDLALLSPHDALLDLPEDQALARKEVANIGHASSKSQPHGLWTYCDALADRLIHELGGRPPSPCIIGLSGCAAGAGVSTLAAGLAASLARVRDTRVLLLDARSHDHRRHRLLGSTSAAGGIDMHVNREGRVVALEHNLFLFGTDDESKCAQQSLLHKWPDMLRMIRDGDYGFVVLNLPPVSPVSPTLPLISHLHSTVLVVRAGRDRLIAVASALQLLSRYRARLSGAVLNRVSPHAPGWLRSVA